MKVFKCPCCFRIREIEENIVMKICPACMVEMEVFEDE